MNIKDLIAEVRASAVNVVNQRGDFEPWCYPIVEGISGDAMLLADEVERLDARLHEVEQERDDANDAHADLHRNLNRRVAGALGLLDERVDAATGEMYLPSWHDMPEQVTALRAEVERLTAANEELHLTLAAEQGRAEGAPSEGWTFGEDCYRKRRWSKGTAECIYGQDGWKWRVGRKRFQLASSARAAMLAAKE